jgi:hypothetical protein
MFAGCLYPCGAHNNVTVGCSTNPQVRNGKQPYSRYIFLNMCNDATRLSFGSSIKLARQFNLFPPRARLVDVGEWNATSGARETHTVFLVIEHPYDSLMRVRPDAEVRMPAAAGAHQRSRFPACHAMPCSARAVQMIMRTEEDEARFVEAESLYPPEDHRRQPAAGRMPLPALGDVCVQRCRRAYVVWCVLCVVCVFVCVCV